MLSGLLFLLSFATFALCCLVILLPKLLSKLFKGRHITRKRHGLILAGATFVLFVAGVMTAPPQTATLDVANAKQVVAKPTTRPTPKPRTTGTKAVTKPASTPAPKPASKPAPAPQPTTAQQVNAWYTKYDYLVTALQNDFSTAQKDLQASDINAFSDDCSKIASDAVTAESAPAIPDAPIETTWMQALGDYAAGGAACTDAISSNDTTELSQGATDFNNGSDALDKTTQQINGLH